MEKKYLFEDEEIISQSDEYTVVLTNIRVRYTDVEFSRATVVSIMLEKVASIEAYFSSNIYLLIAGVLVALFGLITNFNHTNDYGILVAIVGLILIAIYFSSRKYLIVISSEGGAPIRFHAKGMKKEMVFDFINKVEKAVIERRKNCATK